MKEFNMLNLFQILLIKFIMYVYTLKIQQTSKYFLVLFR